MFDLCFKRLQLVVARRGSNASVNHFHCFQKTPLFSSTFSSKSLRGAGQDEIGHTFTVSYLTNSFGLSLEQALSVCKKHKTRFNSHEKPDSVVKLLKEYGLSDAHISGIAKRYLQVLTADPEKTLLPKLEFFNSIGITGTPLVRMLYMSPKVLTLSLERSLKPWYEFSRILRIPEEKVLCFFVNYGHRKLTAEEMRNVARNVSVLLALGVPESSFPLWAHHNLLTLSFESEKVKENVKKVISMGFSPSSPKFMRALSVISRTDALRWEQKVDFYKKWGWTEDDILLAFRKSPLFMGFKEKTISNKMDFVLNKLGYQPIDVARCPGVLTLSLENRIIPRFSVIRVLMLKGLIMREEFSIASVVTSTKKYFLDKFVINYQEQVPELQSIFEGRIGPAKLGLGFEEASGVKQV